ncbi:MAG: hypothetical protein SNG49_02470 [Rikenellaceae bacterium]
MKTKSNSKSQLNEGLQIGAGAVAGVAVGAAGTIAAQPLFAAEASGTSELSSALEDAAAAAALSEQEQVDEPIEAATQESGVECVEVIVNGTSYNVADVNGDGSVSVGVNVVEVQSTVAAETLTEDQTLASSAVDVLAQGEVVVDPATVDVQIEGETFHFADINHDGIADLAAVDLNQDGQISNDEVIDVRGEDFNMSDLAAMQPDTYTNDLAYNQEAAMPDYVNDANVNDFMA